MCKRKVTLKIDFENIDENYIHIFLKHLFYDIKQKICLVVFIFLLYLFNLLMFRHFFSPPMSICNTLLGYKSKRIKTLKKEIKNVFKFDPLLFLLLLLLLVNAGFY